MQTGIVFQSEFATLIQQFYSCWLHEGFKP